LIIETVRIQNFRCVLDETLNCQQLIALIGPNGSGKSTFLTALDVFYNTNYPLREDDFYNRDISKEIVISIEFKQLTPDESKLFQKYIVTGKLIVEKVILWQSTKSNQKYYGASLQNPVFDSFRSAHGMSCLRSEYKKLKEQYGLTEYTNKEECEEILQNWEEANKDQCIRRRDDGQFFGFKEVGKSHLERYTKFILIPAVRNAAEETLEKKGTSLADLMDLVVRSVLAQRSDFTQLEATTQKEYERILDPKKLTELKTIESDLNGTLRKFVPDAGIELNWDFQKTIEIPKPIANIRLVEDDYASSVERVGHGLQRAFILTLFQHLAIVKSTTEEQAEKTDEPQKSPSHIQLPNLIIGIEEPELYQHPSRQRHFSNILVNLASGGIKGVVDFTQIIYSTHSPLFIDMRRLDQIRSIRKVKNGTNMPKQTKITSTNLTEIAEIIDQAEAKPRGTHTSATLEPRLKVIMTSTTNEGFFSNIVVLVEGESDKAAIVGTASALGINFESEDIPIIPCMGKNNLDKPFAIFKKLGITVYPIWDGDFNPSGEQQSNPAENHKLLRLCNQPIEDWPDKITDGFACFKQNLPITIGNELGMEFFTEFKKSCCQKFCLRLEQGEKNPVVFEELIREAKNQGKSSVTIENIITKILALKKKKGL
jgi:putative ATP-dependent endonuclease of the OLD family